MAVREIPKCPVHKNDLVKLSENATHEMWSCTTCNKGYQLPK
jgi:uncharacterized protein YbaR (Trm112 family)